MTEALFTVVFLLTWSLLLIAQVRDNRRSRRKLRDSDRLLRRATRHYSDARKCLERSSQHHIHELREPSLN